MQISVEQLKKIDQTKNRILIDWFSFSSRIDSFDSMASLLGMSDCKWEVLPGVMGYKERYYYEGISIHVGGYNCRRFAGTDKEQVVTGVWLEMSGSGCRAFESYGCGDWQQLIDYCNFNSENITVNRVDLAYDDFLGYLDIDAIAEDTRKHNFVSKFRSAPEIIESIRETETAITVTHGRMSSDVFIRIYDKRLEQNAADIFSHWVRNEVMLRHDRAAAAVALLGDQYDYRDGVRYFIESGKPVDEMYFMIMNNYLRFIVPSATDTNRWRAPVADHWANFCDSITTYRISLFSAPGTDYSALRLDNYVENVCSGVIYTYLKLHGIDKLIEICQSKAYKLAAKYQKLLDDVQEEEESGVLGQVYWEEVLYNASRTSDSDGVGTSI